MATALNIAGLSVAFAAFMVIMMQLDYDWNFDKSHPDHDRIYRVEMVTEKGPWTILARPLADQFISSSPHIVSGSLIYLSFNSDMFFHLPGDASRNNYREPALKVSPNYGDVIEFTMVEGDKDALKTPEHALIPLSLSRKLFQESSAVGKQIKSENTVYTIGGVYKDFPKNTVVGNNIYYPIRHDEHLNDWGNSVFSVFIKLDDPKHATSVVDDFNTNFDASNVWWGDFDLRLTAMTDLHYTTDTQFDLAPKASRQSLVVLFTIAFLIILIAGINFTNFSTALSPMRIKSINTQKVLGAMENTLRGSMVLEAVCISFLSFLIAIGLVYLFSISSLASLVNADLSLSVHVLLIIVTGLISLLTGLLAGTYPAFYITSFSPALVLKGSFGLSPKGRTLRNALISIQFFASFSLIICSIFMYLQNNYMQKSPVGYDKDQLIVTDMPLNMVDKKETLSNQLKSYPGISEVTFSEMLLSSSDQYMDWGRMYRDEKIDFQCLPVDYSFLNVLDIDVVEGRNFRKEDTQNLYGAYIFNEKAKAVYGIELGEKIDGAEIIGIMPDIKFASFRTEVVPMAFYVWGTYHYMFGFLNNYAYIKLDAGTDMKAAVANIQSTLESIEPNHLFSIRFFDDVVQNLYENENRLASLIILFSLIAVFISIVGVFGLVVFDSEYRKKEIGIRKVLGSTVREIIILFNKTYVRILTLCFIISAPIAWYAVSKWLENFAYKTPMYWWVYLIAFLVVLLITSGTVTFQNWRAANENPVNSIKTE